VLISPYPEGSGYVLGHIVASLAPRIPLALLAGSKDNASKDTVESMRRIVERARLNKVELFPSSLHGYKLLRLEPKVTTTITRFLDSTIKLRATEWEPRYNLIPVTVSDILIVRHTKPSEKPDAAKKAQAKEAAKEKPDAPAKAKGQDEQKKPE
jgi:hypothetical protein